MLLQAKPGKGGGTNTAVQGPKDLSLQVAATLDEELADVDDLPRGPHLQHIFPTGVPHLKYQRLVTLADESDWGFGPKALARWQVCFEKNHHRSPGPICIPGRIILLLEQE